MKNESKTQKTKQDETAKVKQSNEDVLRNGCFKFPREYNFSRE